MNSRSLNTAPKREITATTHQPINIVARTFHETKQINYISMETKLAIAEQKEKDTGKLPAKVSMAIGMKVMVATDADI
jgi:hypothetical protein